jgi:hypothetical protein
MNVLNVRSNGILNQSKMKTAVEWLVEQFTYKTTKGIYTTDGVDNVTAIVEQAKEMEKQEMNKVAEVWWNEGASYMYDGKREFESFEQYYNETFKS